MTKPSPLPRLDNFCMLCGKSGFISLRQNDLLQKHLYNCYCPSCAPKIPPDELDENDLWDKDPDSDFWVCYTLVPLEEDF